MEHFASVLRPRGQRPGADLTLTSPGEAEKARRFHSGLPGYAPTPLVSLDGLAHSLGVSKIWIKDESKRFGLNAFKALGGSYAMARCLSEKLGKPLEEMSFEELCAPAARRALGDITFVTATDGNHGRGVAWAARLLGQKAVVYMPKGSAAERLENIRAQGAQAEITEYNYDDAVRLANRMAEEHGWILIQDTAWPGYEEIPAHIMQGYTTLAAETLQQLEEQGAERPTHLFLQAGVGSFAGAALGFFTSVWGEERPVTHTLAAALPVTLVTSAGERGPEYRFSARRFVEEEREAAAWWRERVAALEITTPDEALNHYLNGWCLYQVTACRLMARTSQYQNGGAFGFRDQLQDVCALLFTWPERAREQLLLCASRPFEEGYVQHWWHPPGGAGVRTRISDDLLWLPWVLCRYCRATGDWPVLEETAPYLS